jgi:hypothetical protein
MDLSYEMRRDHLRVIATGPYDAQRARIELCNVLRQADTSGQGRILIDARGITEPVSIGDRYQLATLLADKSKGRVRIAIVVEPMHRETQTFEDTAMNRGVAARTTTSMAEALQFLGISDAQDKVA